MPQVSIIIPNYNHARFLKARLDSVFNQSLQDFEVIFLDDASNDNSLEVLAAYPNAHRVRLVRNDTNSGSSFVQWARGIKLSRGEFVWIAESDDSADPCLLSELVESLKKNPRVGIAYCNSWLVDENDFVIGSMNRHYTQFRDSQRWQHGFVNDGRNECGRYLFAMNTIPNASAVVFRRSAYDAAGGPPSELKLCGDWMLWVRMLLNSDVVFNPNHMNYFRKHRKTVRATSDRSGLSIHESYVIAREIALQVVIAENARELGSRIRVANWVTLATQQATVLSRTPQIFALARAVDPHLRKRLTRQIVRTVSDSILTRSPIDLSLVARAIWQLALVPPKAAKYIPNGGPTNRSERIGHRPSESENQ